MAAPYDVFLIAVLTYADQDDVRLFDPTTAPDTPPVEGGVPLKMLMGVGI